MLKVGYDFKETRFRELHRQALNFPAERFFYVGTAPPPANNEQRLQGEQMVLESFTNDPFGCNTPVSNYDKCDAPEMQSCFTTLVRILYFRCWRNGRHMWNHILHQAELIHTMTLSCFLLFLIPPTLTCITLQHVV